MADDIKPVVEFLRMLREFTDVPWYQRYWRQSVGFANRLKSRAISLIRPLPKSAHGFYAGDIISISTGESFRIKSINSETCVTLENDVTITLTA